MTKNVVFLLFLILVTPIHVNASSSLSSGFDFPAGKPDGVGYTNGSNPSDKDGYGFLEENGAPWHPGEDWNRGLGNTDYGDPVYSISEGMVVASGNFGYKWGNIILIEHTLPSGQQFWSQYAHLKDMILQDGSKEGRVAQVGDIVSRGQ